MQTRWLSKKDLRKVNAALRKAGFAEYPGDRTTAHPDGCGTGYVGNLLDYAGPDRNKVEEIVKEVLA